MVKIYTSNSSASCKKAIDWLNEYNVPYREVNIFNQSITKDDLKEILENSYNGFEDIVSTRSKVMSMGNVDIDEMTFDQACDFLIHNPSALKRPIIVGEKKLQIGYNDEEIRVFIPKEQRQKFVFSESDYRDEHYESFDNIEYAEF